MTWYAGPRIYKVSGHIRYANYSSKRLTGQQLDVSKSKSPGIPIVVHGNSTTSDLSVFLSVGVHHCMLLSNLPCSVLVMIRTLQTVQLFQTTRHLLRRLSMEPSLRVSKSSRVSRFVVTPTRVVCCELFMCAIRWQRASTYSVGSLHFVSLCHSVRVQDNAKA